jgi:hypothetical protein
MRFRTAASHAHLSGRPCPSVRLWRWLASIARRSLRTTFLELVIAEGSEVLRTCGFHGDSFRLEVLEPSRSDLVVVVYLRPTDLWVWDFSGHLEAYLADRVFRNTGLRINRLLVTPLRAEPVALRVARRGMRTLWFLMRAAPRPGQQP